MARNEDGEFELILGNKQLLSVFFLMVLLLGLCFVGGYVLGRSAAPVLNASNEPPPQDTKSLVVNTTPKGEPVQVVPPAPVSEPAPESVPSSIAPPTKTAPQVAADAAPVETKAAPAPPAKPAPPAAKAVPPAAKSAPPVAKATPAAAKQPPATKQPPTTKQTATTKQPPANSQPIPGRIYLQLSATEKPKADAMVDLLRRKNLPGTAAAIADKPGLYRVLVGPLAENALADMKAQLKANGFPADQAIRRVF